MVYFSLIIPVYNRPQEIKELLDSLVLQTANHFEVIVVEDGSQVSSKEIVESYQKQLTLSYYFIPNSGPGKARNYGATKAKGDYLIVLDSDCIFPVDYIENVQTEIEKTNIDVFGGPDRAADNFTNVQKAINYSMTSFLTTGGIRGGKKKMDKFYPRSFNMGIKKEVYEKMNGFADMRFGEDIDFSIRLYEAGYKVALFPSAWVYHKRRTDFRKFFRQVYNSGIARINLQLKHPGSLKLVHFLPSAFTIAAVVLIIGSFFWIWSLLPLFIFILLVFFDATVKTRIIVVGLLSIIATLVQLTGYGLGFLHAFWKRIILRKKAFSSFEKTFYK